MALTIEKAAAVLGISSYILRAEIGRGNLAAYRIGQKKIFIDESEIEDYKRRNQVPITPHPEKIPHNRYVYKLGDKVV